MNRIPAIIEEVVNELKSKDYVEGILLFGSCARDINLPHNDIDFYVLINRNWYQRKSKYYKRVLIELFLNPYEQYLSYFKSDEDLFTAQMFASGKILFDRNGKMSELQKIAKKILSERLELNKDIINEIRYYVADANLDIKNELKVTEYQAMYIMNKTLELLLKSYFRIKKIPEPKYNYIIKKIEEIDPRLYAEIKSFFDENNPKRKFKFLKKIENAILEPIGKPKLTWVSSKKYFY
jgi:predicted nucleotidyltransferase